MNICCDLDDTLFESNVIMDVVNQYGLPYKREDIKTWEIVELPEYCRMEIRKRWKLPEYMCNLKPCENSEEKIRKWHNEGHKIFCITSRDLSIEKETKNMVRKHFPGITETFVVNGSKNKVLSEIKPDLFIDDGPHYVIESINLNIKTVMISNNHTPYNHFLRSSIYWKKKVADIDLEEICRINQAQIS